MSHPSCSLTCIRSYLNSKGCEEEGIYRVPGSDREIKQWYKRFDQELDVDLLNEPKLFDVNCVSSLFKQWLRELPTKVLPEEIQEKIQLEHPDATEVPQLMKDELSNLPPWNYYLLFAITCHLSLLMASQEKTKMNYSNLITCFKPSLKIEHYCFNFLVNHWRDCWQGCNTEKDALEQEYRAIDGIASSSGSSVDERSNVGDRSMPPPINTKVSSGRGNQSKPTALNLARAGDDPPPSTPMRPIAQHNGHARSASQLPELEPVKPLSPLMGHYS